MGAGIEERGGDECKIEELKGWRGREQEVERADRRCLICLSEWGGGGGGDKTVYWGARPGTAKLTGSSKSQVSILQEE